MKRIRPAAFLVALAVPFPLAAGEAHEHRSSSARESPSALAEGEVRRVDREAQKLSIRHGPLPNLDMPPMTMVFRVKDPTMLEQLEVGDRIRFRADKLGAAYVVTHIEAAK